MNGAINTSTLTCTTCHGNKTLVASGLQDPNVAAAPTGTGAPDTYGNTAIATANGVGVHAAHVLGTRSKPVLCNACHTVPGAQIHKTGVATAGTVALANLSTTGGIANATYAGAGGTCSNTYCHGNLGGGVGATNVTPTWKTSATLVCNACHGVPPATTSTGRFHPNRTDCGACHAGYTGTTVNATAHVNGVVDYTAQTCTTCHGDAARTGIDAAGIAFSSAPPADASGLLTGGTKIGAHTGHLLTGASGWPHLVEAGRLLRVPQRLHPDEPAPRQRPGQRRLRHPRQDRHRHGGRARGSDLFGRHLLEHLLPRQLRERRRRERHQLEHGNRRPAAAATARLPAGTTPPARRSPPAATATATTTTPRSRSSTRLVTSTDRSTSRGCPAPPATERAGARASPGPT